MQVMFYWLRLIILYNWDKEQIEIIKIMDITDKNYLYSSGWSSEMLEVFASRPVIGQWSSTIQCAWIWNLHYFWESSSEVQVSRWLTGIIRGAAITHRGWRKTISWHRRCETVSLKGIISITVSWILSLKMRGRRVVSKKKLIYGDRKI